MRLCLNKFGRSAGIPTGRSLRIAAYSEFQTNLTDFNVIIGYRKSPPGYFGDLPPAPACGVLRQFPSKNRGLDNSHSPLPGKLAISCGNHCEYNLRLVPSRVLLRAGFRVRASRPPKFSSDSARRISACLGAFRLPAAEKKQNKGSLKKKKKPVTKCKQTGLADARTWGVHGHIPSLARAGAPSRLLCGLAWFGPAADLAAGTLISPGACGPDQETPASCFGGIAMPSLSGGRGCATSGLLRGSAASMMPCGRSRCATATATAACPLPRSSSLPSSMPRRARDGCARLGEVNCAINLAVEADKAT